MKKKILFAFAGLGILVGSVMFTFAVTCTNNFPTSLNNYASGDCIPSSWGRALEAKIGIDNSAVATSLDYLVRHIVAITSLNGLTTSTQTFSTSSGGSSFSITSSGSVHTFNFPLLPTFTNVTSTGASITNLSFTNASGTNASVSGYGLFPTLFSTNAALTNVSSTNASVSGYGLFPTLNLTNASGTNYSASGYGLFPSLSSTNSSSTNETLGGYLRVTGQTTLGNVSSTNYSASGYGLFPTLNFTNASGTNVSVSGYGIFPTLNFTNASGTNATLSGDVTASTATFTTATSTNHSFTTKLQAPTNQTLTTGGQVSVKTTSSTLNFHDGTAERVLNPESCFVPSFTIENPGTSEDIPLMIFNATSTITKIRAVNKTNSDTVTFNVGYSSSRATASSSLNKAFTSYQAVTATTTISNLTINGSSTPSSGSILRFLTSAASSTQFTLDVCYKQTP